MIAALLDHLWQSTLFCGAAWLLTLTLRGNPAAVRHGLWAAAALKFLVPFSALFWLGTLFGFAAPVDTGPPMFGGHGDAAPVMLPAFSLSDATRDAAPVLVAGCALVWLAGALLASARWFRAWRAAERITRSAEPRPGLPADVRVVAADIEPAAARVFRPVVLLPAALLETLTAAQLAAVIAHERVHISRRDNLFSHLQCAVEALFWFHPLVRWIGRRMVDERERACDERVLETGHDAGAYAAGILAVCRLRLPVPRTPAAASALSGDLTLRIGNILGDARPRGLGALKAAALSIAAVTVAAGPLAAGAVDDAARRHRAFVTNERLLDSAQVYVDPAHEPGEAVFSADEHAVHVRNSTVRELVASAYDARPAEISGGDWLDAGRYEIRIESSGALVDPDDLDPRALRGVVNKLLASRFDILILVNGQVANAADAAR